MLLNSTLSPHSSTITESSRTEAELNLWQQSLIGCFLSITTIISIFGNVLVCVAILTHRKLKKVSNLFLISLAIADLVVSSLVMPFAIANDLLQYWPFAQGFCNIWISFDILSATASILNLCAISIDRYIHMTNPFGYERWMTNRKCLGFIALIWLLSILISFLPINLGWHKKKIDFSSSISALPSSIEAFTESQKNENNLCFIDLSSTYAVISSSISFFLPCLVMVAIYIKMYNLARRHAESIKKTQAYVVQNGSKSKANENKALFTLGMIMGLFLLCWIPFFTVNIVIAFCEKCVPKTVFTAFSWLGYFNSTMNPIIYSKFNADFRDAFRIILFCERCRDRDPYKMKIRSRTSSNIMAMKKIQSSTGNTQNGVAKIHANGGNVEHHQNEVQTLIVKGDINDNLVNES
ncbi:dop-1 [Bugula neritina]|uniref:Dop-1 n=1 Tax=Bugula neritina TaxID=10212 RepID=A0A7J7JTG9_BUGNE|nr:dop-1 [Bugula neritina]